MKNNNKNSENLSRFFYSQEKMAVFIDGANLYAAAKSLNFDIDYKRLLTWISTQSRLVRAFYYTALMEDQEYSPLRPLIDWLDYNGYRMVTRTVKEYTDPSGRKRYRGSVDVDLAVDMVDLAENVDHILLFSGDGDFRRLLLRKAVGRDQPRDSRSLLQVVQIAALKVFDQIGRAHV